MSQSNDQTGLGDFDYSQHEKETPDSYVKQVEDEEDIFSLEQGDEVWIDGDTYTVIGNALHFLTPPPKHVIGEDGSQHQLVAGTIPREDTAGVAWRSQLSDKESDEISRSDLLSEYDDVYITYQGDNLEHFHAIIPESPSRRCPHCDSKGGTVKHHEIQQNTSVEVRVCTNSDCGYIYQHTQEIDQDSTAELIFRDHEQNTFRLETISGYYEVEDQDDFKIPLETHDGIHDGYRTAEQIADFLNKKMVTKGISDLLKQPSFAPGELLELLEFSKEKTGIAGTTEIELTEWGEILAHHCETQLQISLPDNLIEQVSTATATAFAKSLRAIHTAIKKQEELANIDAQQTKSTTSPAMTDGGKLMAEDLEVLIPLLTETSVTANNPIQRTLIQTFTESLSGRTFLTSTPFYNLITKTADNTVFGKVDYDRGLSNHRSKTESDLRWVDDVKKYDQMMQVTYSEYNHHTLEPFSISFKWSMDEYDLTDHLVT